MLTWFPLAPILARQSGEADSRTAVSRDAKADGLTRQPPLRARPPFTRPWPLFLECGAELIRGQTSPADFCNETRRATTNRSSRFLAGTEASTSFLFSTCHALSLARTVTRGEPRHVRSSDPSAGSSHLRGFAQP
jgi:hypothetical protein